MRLHARPARAVDIPDLVVLVQSAYRGDASRAGWTTEADLVAGQRLDPAMAREMLRDRDGVVLLVRDDAGRAVACVQLRDLGVGDDGRRGAYFGLFAVAPDLQGSGVGAALMRVAEEHVRGAWAADVLRMTVISVRTELLDYYARRGYADTGEREPFPYGDDQFGDPLRDDLEFAVLAKDLTP